MCSLEATGMARVLGINYSEQHYPNLMRVDMSIMREKSCLVCDFIGTATTFTREGCHETFKIQSVRKL